MDELFVKCIDTHENGQKEYAGDSNDVYANFKRVAKATDSTPMQVLLVYLLKHIDGITNYIKGHETQREPIEGRIVDSIVYLTLLSGMIEEEDKKSKSSVNMTPFPGVKPMYFEKNTFVEDPDNE
jgi:hypothetical protein